MGEKQLGPSDSPTTTARVAPEPPSSVSRRHFLRNTVIASAAASLGQTGTAHGQTPGAGAGGGGGGGRQQGAVPSPTAATPLGPGTPESWNEPWVWRPGDWPGQQLHLNVVENESPGSAVGFGNPGAILFSYGGNTPWPTIRMRGDETLFVKLRNLLGEDLGNSFIREYPDTAPGGRPPGLSADEVNAKAEALGHHRHDFCLGETTNGLHTAHVTNLHTHGLHVRPGRNPDGTHSDNVILRVMPQADLRQREAHADDPACQFLHDPRQIFFLRDDEQAGEADYEFQLGHVEEKERTAENLQRIRDGETPRPPQPHPAGTFWYHPHAHGATHNQVASGMAGFLIVEGDIDDAVNVVLAGTERLDPELPTGPRDYRERLMFM